MSQPFNFFQYEYTGAGTGIAPYISTPYGVDPTASGFGIFFLPDSFRNSSINFNFPLLSEFILYPPTFSANISGNIVDSNLHTVSQDFQFYGNFFPLSNETGDFNFKITGSFIRDNIDPATFDTPFSGNIIGGLLDSPVFVWVFSGNQQGALVDTQDNDFIITGEQNSTNLDPTNTLITISGRFFKHIMDSSSVDLRLFSGVFSKGNVRVSGLFDNEASVNFYNSRIIWGVAQ